MPQPERELIDGVERRLAEKYAAFPVDHVSAVVRHAYAQFQSSRVRDFIPLLVQRRADEELDELSVLRPDLAAVALGEFGMTGPFAAHSWFRHDDLTISVLLAESRAIGEGE